MSLNGKFSCRLAKMTLSKKITKRIVFTKVRHTAFSQISVYAKYLVRANKYVRRILQKNEDLSEFLSSTLFLIRYNPGTILCLQPCAFCPRSTVISTPRTVRRHRKSMTIWLGCVPSTFLVMPLLSALWLLRWPLRMTPMRMHNAPRP